MPSTDLDRSYPSPPIAFADVPEVKNFAAQFIYNFFVPDESIVDVGIDVDKLTRGDLERKLERSAPRFVQLNFTPVRLTTRGNSNEFRDHNSVSDDQASTIVRNLDRVLFEHALAAGSYTGVRFQDDQIDRKLYEIVSGTVAARVTRHNKGVSQQFAATEQHIQNTLRRENVNMYDAARLLSTGMGSSEAQFILNSLNQLRVISTRFMNEDAQREQQTAKFNVVKDVGLDVQVNSRFAGSILTSIVQDPISMYADEVRPTLQRARDEQASAVSAHDPGSIDANEYETYADPIRTRNVDVSSFNTRRSVIGYVIDKTEVRSNGNVIQHNPIIINRGDATTAYDVDIAYNRKYMYAVRSIVEVEFIASYDGEDEVVAATILISSKPSVYRTVETIENVPPPPPADFNVDWDRTSRAARLTWNFPVNNQRDIKKWQIFRRKSINEPFELIKEYDFDDSVVKTPSGERVSATLTERVASPVNFYIDHDFDRASKYIYTLCSIDAHGLSSNYGVQFEATYDQSRNDIKKKLISSSGAPKAYPNMYVDQDDVIVDVIRDSGHSQVEVYFDPEALDVTDGRRGSLGLLSTDVNDGVYRLQLINSDLQQAANLDIVVKDRRTSQATMSKLIQSNRRGVKPTSGS